MLLEPWRGASPRPGWRWLQRRRRRRPAVQPREHPEAAGLAAQALDRTRPQGQALPPPPVRANPACGRERINVSSTPALFWLLAWQHGLGGRDWIEKTRGNGNTREANASACCEKCNCYAGLRKVRPTQCKRLALKGLSSRCLHSLPEQAGPPLYNLHGTCNAGRRVRGGSSTSCPFLASTGRASGSVSPSGKVWTLDPSPSPLR